MYLVFLSIWLLFHNLLLGATTTGAANERFAVPRARKSKSKLSGFNNWRNKFYTVNSKVENTSSMILEHENNLYLL